MTIVAAFLLLAAGASPVSPQPSTSDEKSAAAARPASSVFEATLNETSEKTPEVSFAELKQILAQKSAVVFDSRPAREFGLGHIPGALNVAPKAGVPISLYVSDVHEMERAVKGDKATPVVLYCNGPFCGKSKRLAAELLEAGFKNVRRFQLGMPVWRALGGVQQMELEGVRTVLDKDKTAWLLDSRGTAGLPGARGLVPAEVKKAKDDGRLPMEDHHTRIVVVGSGEAQARALAEAVAKEAFDNVAYFAGDASTLSGGSGSTPTVDR